MMDSYNYDYSVKKSLNDVVLEMPDNLKGIAQYLINPDKTSSQSTRFIDRVAAALILAGSEERKEVLIHVCKVASGFEILWINDYLRKKSWVGSDGTIREPAMKIFGAAKARILGNSFQALSRSLVLKSTMTGEYIIFALKLLDEASLHLTNSNSYLLEMEHPISDSILKSIEKRAEFWGCVALANKALHNNRINNNDETLRAVKGFGSSFGMAYQLWIQMRFVAEVQQGNHWGEFDMLKQDYINAYPVSLALKNNDSESYIDSIANIEKLDVNNALNHTKRFFRKHIDQAKSVLGNSNLPIAIQGSWSNIVEQLSLAAQGIEVS